MSHETPEVEYSSPLDSLEEGVLPQHRFDLIKNGEKIGGAEIDYFSKPLPLYQLTDLYIDSAHQGQGYAGELLDQVEAFLTKRKKPGVLVDAIMEDDPASGMYARRGWKEVPGGFGLHVFNWPDEVDLEILRGYSFRYTDPMIRPGYQQESPSE